jgi:DNA polymerase-1
MVKVMSESQKRKRKGNSNRFVPALLGCLKSAGLPCMDRAIKDGNRNLISAAFAKLPASMQQNIDRHNDLDQLGDFNPYTPDEWQKNISDYCQDDDVEGTAALFLNWIGTREYVEIGQAMFRGAYTTAAAEIEWNGVPLDAIQLARISVNRTELKNRMAEALEREHHYGAYKRVEKGRKGARYVEWTWDRVGAVALLDRMGIKEEWLAMPGGATPAGGVSFADPSVGGDDKKIFKVMAEKYEELRPLRDVHKFHSGAKKFGFLLGPDNRNRPRQAAWWTNTGRTQPFDSVWPEASWLRFLIMPATGRAVAYIDLVSAEFGIAAALSNDPNMMAVYLSGEDVYAALGRRINRSRKIAKIASLATGYGQTAQGLAIALSTRSNPVSPRIARGIIDDIDRQFPVRRAWVEAVRDEAEFVGHIDSILGWRTKLIPEHNPNSLLNFKMQAGCGDIMRLAVVYMLQAGLMICTTVHDAVMIEADFETIIAHTAIAQECWERASRELLGGFQLRSDFKITCSCGIMPCPHGQSIKDVHQGRYNDEDGLAMWDKVQSMLDEIEKENRERQIPVQIEGAV